MQYLTINIEGQTIDYELTPQQFFITYSIKSLEDFSKIGGALTERSLNIPCTTKNNRIFNNYWDVSGLNEDAAEFKNIEISDGGQFSFVGKCILKNVELYGDNFGLKGGTYKLACFGDNSSFIIDLENKLMRDLSRLPAPVDYIGENIILGWQGNYLARDYAFNLIKCGNWDTPGEVSIFRSTPGLFIAPLIENIFNDLGFTVFSNWLQLEQTRRLFLPLIPFNNVEETEEYANAIANVAAESTSTTTQTVQVQIATFDTQTQQPTTGANPYNLATGVYTAQYDGIYNFTCEISFDNTPGTVSTDYGLGFFKNANNAIFPGAGKNGPGARVFNLDVVAELVAGDTVELKILKFVSGNLNYVCSKFNVYAQINFSEGVPVLFDLLLRDFKQKNFIIGLQQLFNLQIDCNSSNNSVTIEPEDNYFSIDGQLRQGYYNDLDQSKIIDLKGTHRLKNAAANTAKNLNYEFTTSDPTSEALNQGKTNSFNDGLYIFPNDKYKSEAKRIKIPIHKQPELLDSEVVEIDDNNEVLFQLPLIWPENYFTDKSPEWQYPAQEFRLLYHAGRNLRVRINTTELGLQFPPHTFMVQYVEAGADSFNLSFSAITRNGVTRPGLLQIYFINQLKRIQVSKVLQTWVFWRLLEISSLSFRKKILIDNSQYVVQQIKNYNPLSNEATKTILLYDSPVTLQDFNNIQINNNYGLIIS